MWDLAWTASSGRRQVEAPEPLVAPLAGQRRACRCALLRVGPAGAADRTRLDQALARIRKGFKHDEILPGWHIEVAEEEAYSHRDDELGGKALLTLPAVLTLEPLA